MNTRLTILILMLMASAAARSQSFNATMNGSLSLSSVMEVTVTPGSGSNVTIDGTNINSGITNSNLSSIKIKSNELWILSVRASSIYFTASGIYTSTNMPVSVLKILSPGRELTLSTSNQPLAQGGRGTNDTPGNSFQVGMKANPGYSYGPGIYTTNLMYTLTPQ